MSIALGKQTPRRRSFSQELNPPWDRNPKAPSVSFNSRMLNCQYFSKLAFQHYLVTLLCTAFSVNPAMIHRFPLNKIIFPNRDFISVDPPRVCISVSYLAPSPSLSLALLDPLRTLLPLARLPQRGSWLVPWQPIACLLPTDRVAPSPPTLDVNGC